MLSIHPLNFNINSKTASTKIVVVVVVIILTPTSPNKYNNEIMGYGQFFSI